MRWASALALAAAALVLPSIALAESSGGLYPIHGTVLQQLAGDRAVVRIDPVTQTQDAQTRQYRIAPAQTLRPGTQIDAFADGARLIDVTAAPAFVAGTYDPAANELLSPGDLMPPLALIDQTGKLLHFADFKGKTTLVSFIFTRCPDRTICPAITGKFLYLQQHLDPSRFHLVEVTLDPNYDSPAVLKRYGMAFAADASRWSLVTGEPHEIGAMIDRFGIASIADRPGDYIHDDRLVVVDPHGRIASEFQTIGWSPDDAIALARSTEGEGASPLRIFWANTIANIIALCSGGDSIDTALLDVGIFFLGAFLLCGATYWVGRQIFSEKI